MKKIVLFFSCLVLPGFLLKFVLRMLGCKVGRNVKIGFSIILTTDLRLHDNARIGHFNYIKINSLELKESAYIGSFNICRGPFSILLKKRAAIGRSCLIRRSRLGVTYGKSELVLGELSKLTAYHFVDLTKSIVFGDFSTLAGIRSQLWTHGYVHAPTGPDRFRVDGEITIGNNVYIGSGVIINPGVTVADAINIGGGATVAKSLEEVGMYVSQPLRKIDKDYNSIMVGLSEVMEEGLLEKVYEK